MVSQSRDHLIPVALGYLMESRSSALGSGLSLAVQINMRAVVLSLPTPRYQPEEEKQNESGWYKNADHDDQGVVPEDMAP